MFYKIYFVFFIDNYIQSATFIGFRSVEHSFPPKQGDNVLLRSFGRFGVH